MKCKSCEGEVPPKFAHAITMNCCPLCGEEIMDAALQSILIALKEAMKSISIYPNEIFDWFKSNYNLYTQAEVDSLLNEEKIKLSSRSFIVKNQKNITLNPEEVQLNNDGNQIKGQPLQSVDQTNKFFKNALIKTPNNQDNLKNLVNQIKKSGSSGAAPMTPELIEALGIDPNEIDPIEANELHAAFGYPIDNDLDSEDMDYENDIPDIVLNMSNNKGAVQKDLLMLQKMQQKSAAAKNEIARTGSVGLIKR